MFNHALSKILELRTVELVSVDSSDPCSARMLFDLPQLSTTGPGGELRPIGVAPSLDGICPGIFPFRFLDASALGSESESVGLAIYDAFESERAKASLIAAWRAVLPYSGLKPKAIERVSGGFDEIDIVGCIGDSGQSIFLTGMKGWPTLGVLDIEVVALGDFGPEDIELSWGGFAEMLDWYVSDVAENSGSAWRYINDQGEQYRIERVR